MSNTEQKKSPKKLIIVTAIVLALGGLGVALFQHLSSSRPTRSTPSPEATDGGPSDLASHEDSAPKIGVLYGPKTLTGQSALVKGLNNQLEGINRERESKSKPLVELIFREVNAGPDGAKKQAVQLRELIDEQVKAIIVQPASPATLMEPLELTNREGIPVVACGREVVGGKLATFITSDNYQAGYLAGEYMAATLSTEKKLRIAVVHYPADPRMEVRLTGFTDALEQAEVEHEILETHEVTREKGPKEIAAALLESFPKTGSLDAVFAVNDAVGLPVAKALIESDRKEVFFASADGDPAFAKLICDNEMSGISTAQFFAEVGATCMRASYDALLKKKIPREMVVPVFPVTRETCARYEGWEAPLPDRFEKPWKSETPLWRGELKKLPEEE